MILAYASVVELSARLHRVLPHDEICYATDDWAEFEGGAQSANCLVVAEPALHASGLARHVERLAGRLSFVPLLVVTDRDPENARCLCRIGLEAIVWTHDIERELGVCVERARGRSLLSRVGGMLALSRHLPPVAREALVVAAQSAVPPASITELCHIAHCHRSTLWMHWHRATNGAHSPRLEDVLGWFQILYAAGHKRAGRKWTEVAQELGMHTRTLERVIVRLSGMRLRDIEGGATARLIDRFSTDCLMPLGLSPMRHAGPYDAADASSPARHREIRAR